MTKTRFSIAVEIPAPAGAVWRVMAAVERWPEWTASVKQVKLLTPGPLAVSGRVQLHQPGFPPARWQVTDLEEGRRFTWVSQLPFLRVTARHEIKPANSGSCATLSICYAGWLGPLMALLTRNVNDRYLAMEANGLKARSLEGGGVKEVSGGVGPDNLEFSVRAHSGRLKH